jgi:hypothetical protein
MARPNAEDNFDLSVLNTVELQKLFSELQTSVQNRIVLQGMRNAAQIILQQAKSNFKSRQKGKSKTGYKDFNKSFATAPMRSQFGLVVGVKNYKYKWSEWGTAERSYKTGVKKSLWKKTNDGSGHKTGKVVATYFFFDAVRSKSVEAQNAVSNAIVESLERTVKKFEKQDAKT